MKNKNNKLNPVNKMDAYCYQIKDSLKVLQAMAKINERESFKEQARHTIKLLELSMNL